MSISQWIKTILYMVASIGALLVGFEILSNNVAKLCHKGLKKLFGKTSKSKLAGVGIGIAATAIMQSSSATTIMVVGFVNTGIMTLTQATAIIMGANIGTTITAQLAALNSFSFSDYAIALAGIGIFINMLSKKEKTKTLGNALAGFGLLFFGLMNMSDAMKAEEVKNAIGGILTTIDGPFAPWILFLMGVILTAIVQSSALITTIIISLTSAGIYIGAGSGATALNNNVLFLILGTNIGTCVTALLSSAGATTNAKRAGIIHLLFNTFGAFVFMIPLFIFKNFMSDTLAKVFATPATQIAMFHTFFNVACTIIFLPFIRFFVLASEFLIKDKGNKAAGEETFTYIDERMIKSPSIAIHQVRKEMGLMYNKAVDVLNISVDAFYNRDMDKKEIVDKMNKELETTNKLITEFLVKLENESLTFDDECTVTSFLRSLNDILRIGEIGDNICKYTRHMVMEELVFSDNVLLQVGFMRSTINALYQKTDEVFLSKDINRLKEIDEVENKVDKMRKELIDDHFDRLNKGECKPQNSGVFVNLVNNLERAADHMTYIAYSVKEALDQTKNG